MLSNHIIFCHLLLLLPSIFLCIRVFSNESAVGIRWPEYWSFSVKVKSLSRVRLYVIPWTVAYQAPLSMGFSRQEYCSGLPFPFPGDLPNPGIEHGSAALQTDALALPSEPRKPLVCIELDFLLSGHQVALYTHNFTDKEHTSLDYLMNCSQIYTVRRKRKSNGCDLKGV